MLKVESYENNFDIEINDEGTVGTINGSDFEIDVQAQGTQSFHVLNKTKGYNIDVVSADYNAKEITLLVNGNKYPVKVKDNFDLLLDKLGMSNALSQVISEVKAPMPGLVLEIKVSEGDKIEKGDAIFVLEAMKMENVLKSPTEGVIKKVVINKGDAVEKNQVLLIFE